MDSDGASGSPDLCMFWIWICMELQATQKTANPSTCLRAWHVHWQTWNFMLWDCFKDIPNVHIPFLMCGGLFWLSYFMSRCNCTMCISQGDKRGVAPSKYWDWGKGDSRNTCMWKGSFLWMVPLAHHAGTRDICPALAAFVDPVQFFAVHYTANNFLFMYS